MDWGSTAIISGKGWGILFVLLHVVTHPGNVHGYHVVLVSFVPACPESSEIADH